MKPMHIKIFFIIRMNKDDKDVSSFGTPFGLNNNSSKKKEYNQNSVKIITKDKRPS